MTSYTKVMVIIMKNKKKKKNKKWIRPRHALVRGLLNITLGVYARKKYGAKIEKIKDSNKRPYLLLYNHQTGFDQFFIGMTCKRPVYYLASEDIFSMGFLSRLIEYLVKPIPIKKQTNDPRAVINCIKVAKEGGTIAIAPEGNRTYSGRTCYIKPTISSLARHLNLPIAFIKLEGGYGVQPRWSDKVRGGGMNVRVSRVMEPEEYKELSDEELLSVIREELWQDEAVDTKEYTGNRLAEHLERAIYVCPDCGLSEFESHGDIICCKRCQRKVRYLPSTELSGVDSPFPFRFVADWYEYQENYVRELQLSSLPEEPLYTEDCVFERVIVYKKKEPMFKEAEISLYKDKITVSSKDTTLVFPFDELSAVSVLGKNKLNLYHGKELYQVSGNRRLCALKYVNLYYKHLYETKGEDHEGSAFLGI